MKSNSIFLKHILKYLLILYITLPISAYSQEQNSELKTLIQQADNFEKSGNKSELARCNAQLGAIYKENNNTAKALEHFQKSLKLNEALGNLNAVKNNCINIALIYTDNDNSEQALVYFKKILKINEKQGKQPEILGDLINIGQALQSLKNYTESNQYIERAASIAQELSNISSLKNSYMILYENYDKLGNIEKAKEYFELASSIKSKLQKEELKKFESRTKQAEAEVYEKESELISKDKKIIKISKEQQLTLDMLQQQKELSELKDREFQSKEKLQQARQRNINIIIGSMAFILLLISLFFFFIFKQLREKKKAYTLLEQSKQEIIEQKQEIEEQRDIATQQKRKITDSINYAQRIQKAVLPPISSFEKVLPEHFILFRPRDIVSGDFYWMTEKEGIVILAAVDCTGHGVPGAFMSMLGVAFLNDIVNKMTVNKHIRSLHANEILNQLRDHVITSLHQSGKTAESKDGMDMALCILDYENSQLQYAGAHNPVYIISNGELKQIEGDKMPIGIYKTSDISFKNHEITLTKGDLVYIFSDGYFDQFGGTNRMKMFSSVFRKYIFEIHKHSMAEQRRLLEEYYDNWKGKNEQVDDVLVIGFKFTPNIQIPSNIDFLWPDKHILIAEDVDFNFILMVEALKPTKARVSRAVNGHDAVEICKTADFDLVLMDIRMPIMDGIEATRIIKSFKPNLPVIAQTANAEDGDLDLIREVGCDDYISKPINLKIFLSVIQKNIIKQ
jgi:CheY-like chemotaxis protein/tetratricopeptide (TPR) repeat protein